MQTPVIAVKVDVEIEQVEEREPKAVRPDGHCTEQEDPRVNPFVGMEQLPIKANGGNVGGL